MLGSFVFYYQLSTVNFCSLATKVLTICRNHPMWHARQFLCVDCNTYWNNIDNAQNKKRDKRKIIVKEIRMKRHNRHMTEWRGLDAYKYILLYVHEMRIIVNYLYIKIKNVHWSNSFLLVTSPLLLFIPRPVSFLIFSPYLFPSPLLFNLIVLPSLLHINMDIRIKKYYDSIHFNAMDVYFFLRFSSIEKPLIHP